MEAYVKKEEIVQNLHCQGEYYHVWLEMATDNVAILIDLYGLFTRSVFRVFCSAHGMLNASYPSDQEVHAVHIVQELYFNQAQFS